MLSAIVLYDATAAPSISPAEAMARTLGSLVRANVEGLLGDVSIAGPAGDGLARLADHAGCRLIEAETEAGWLHAAIAAAGRPRILLLRSGFAPQEGFVDEAEDLPRRRPASGREVAVLRAAPGDFLQRLFPAAAPAAGLIAPRERALAARARRFGELVQALRPATTLRVRARPVG